MTLIRSPDQILATLARLNKFRPMKRRAGRLASYNTRRTKVVRKWPLDPYEVPATQLNTMQSGDLFLGVSSYDDLLRTKFIERRLDKGLSTYQRHFSVLVSRGDWEYYLEEYFGGTHTFIHLSKDSAVVTSPDDSYSIEYSIHSKTIEIGLVGDLAQILSHYEMFTEVFEEVTNEIEWIYSGDGQSINVPLRADRQPVDEMYPFLGDETLAAYYDRFMSSDASILLLIGPPGTGKTTFIRGFLQHTKSSAVVTYDAGILEKDYVFAQFIEGDKNVMVLEDADMFLKARSEGNTMMHKFLNVGDGLVSTKNKKMIFSTNLPSIKDIDSALIRPGRCFDILKFDPLNREQAEALANRLGVNISDDDKHSIAEIFHKKIDAPVIRNKVGFI